MTHTADLERLKFVPGRWITTGVILDEDGSEVATISGTDVYEPMPGGRWIIHHVDDMMGDEPTRAMELIGDADADGVFRGRAFEAGGAYDEMTSTELPDGAWRLDGDGVRSTLRSETPTR